MTSPPQPLFVGRGARDAMAALGRPAAPWRRDENDDGSLEDTVREHPEHYRTDSDLVHAVNTAMILGKPLLLTGRPGTGKSQLADRIAWEFGLSPVLRFECQSISEAQDLFYSYDMVSRLAAVQIARAGVEMNAASAASDAAENTAPQRFIGFGPLGKAMLRAAPRRVQGEGASAQAFDEARRYDELYELAFLRELGERRPRRSVVLIDEIDKTSRDFPNDLLNGIDRLEFRIRELNDLQVKAPDDEALRPIVVITSNSERDLPEPFLRRCAYHHVADPDDAALRRIIHARLFAAPGRSDGDATLPKLVGDMVNFFVQDYRKRGDSLAYVAGTTELLDWVRAVRRLEDVDMETNVRANLQTLKRAIGAMIKRQPDRDILVDALRRWEDPQRVAM